MRYREFIDKEWKALRMRAIEAVDDVWESSKGKILRIPEAVFRLSTFGTRGRKSDWWCPDAAVAVS